MAHFINDGLAAVLPLMYPLYSLYGLSFVTVTVLVSLQSIFSILISPLVGSESDRSGNYSMMLALGLGLLAVGATGYAVSVYFSSGTLLAAVLVPFTVLIGVGSSFYHPLGATILRSKVKHERIGYAMGMNGSAGSIGRVALPFTSTLVLSYFSLPYLGLVTGLSMAGIFASYSYLRGIRFRDAPPSAPTPPRRRKFLPDRDLTRRLLPLTAVSFSRGIFTGVFPLVPLYLQQVDGFSGVEAGLVFSLSLGIGVVSQLVFGYLQTKLGAKRALAISNLGGVATLFVFVLSSDHAVIISTLVVFGLFSYSAFPLLLGVVHDRTRIEENTSGSAIVWGVGNSGGSAAAPLIVGALAVLYSGSPVVGFLASAVIGILSVVLMPFV